MTPQLKPTRIERAIEYTAVMLASGFFASYLPAKLVARFRITWGKKSLADRKWTGAGIIGSLWGAVTYLILPLSLAQSIPPVFLGFLSACAISHIAEKSINVKDDPRIIIDEWIGTWVALYGFQQTIDPTFVLAFIFFRIFDVIKGPWGRALQHLPGGIGIVMDDILAGLLANLLTRLLLFLGLHYWY